MDLANLPLEIIPLIIQHLLRAQHLVQACSVNKNFYSYTVPQLYEHPVIFAWHREGKKKATQLFSTLANCPQLARYVRRLELRDFPKAISRESSQELTRTCVRAIQNCVNLRSCIWTREGSLKDDILEVLSSCPHLDVLEINGHHAHNYDPALLSRFTKLRKFSLIMPSSEVMQVLPACFQSNFDTLQTLTIICKFTTVVTDGSLKSMAPALARLNHLHIAGCPRVTHHGIIDLLHANATGIVDLALEGVSPSFDMKELGTFCQRTHALSHLQSITLTFPISGVSRGWLADVEALLRDAPLRRFHLYASGGQVAGAPSLDASFVQNFVRQHADSLVRLAVLRLPVSVHNLDFIVRNATKLEELFVSMRRSDLGMLGPTVAKSRSLRSLHVTYAFSADDGDGVGGDALAESDDIDADRPRPSMEELGTIASHFGPSVTQFGVETRVWQVERVSVRQPGGELSTAIRLGPYESPDVPDVFLVVRT